MSSSKRRATTTPNHAGEFAMPQLKHVVGTDGSGERKIAGTEGTYPDPDFGALARRGHMA
jgi:hypothetical protein